MEWTHWGCAMAGCFVGSFLVAVWKNQRRQSSDEPTPLVKGGWYPKASNPVPPPPPPAPPPLRPVPPSNLRIKSGVIPTAEEVLTRRSPEVT